MDTQKPVLTQLNQRQMFDVDNLCIGVCTSNAKGYCKGCLRSRQERFHWHEMSNNQKHIVAQLCDNRKKRILARRQKEQLSELENIDFIEEASSQLDLF